MVNESKYDALKRIYLTNIGMESKFKYFDGSIIHVGDIININGVLFVAVESDGYFINKIFGGIIDDVGYFMMKTLEYMLDNFKLETEDISFIRKVHKKWYDVESYEGML